jgi:hypothetical protein
MNFFTDRLDLIPEKSDITLLSLFSSSRVVWKDIVDECNRKFKNIEIFVAKYEGNNWDNYFYNFYAQDSDCPGEIQFSGEDKKILKISETEVVFLPGLSKEEKLNNLMSKGKNIKKFGTDMLIIKIPFDRHSKKCHAENVLSFKSKIRKKFEGKTINKYQIEKWMIIHSFLPGKKSLNALNLIKNNCTIMNIIGEKNEI